MHPKPYLHPPFVSSVAALSIFNCLAYMFLKNVSAQMGKKSAFYYSTEK